MGGGGSGIGYRVETLMGMMCGVVDLAWVGRVPFTASILGAVAEGLVPDPLFFLGKLA